ncbi:dihydrodipicolinate synthase family protein [Ornithinicoccus halotolerans]|uniref:dihydrodipicolinate synthase family protein n=1 Tax=Ornithinicoccus halotolerans TaxID=1748220 RepID=UPI001295E474|nr:dihydrodipicolinate synthase family protein [Ornithinicoccus halotolerans]
MSQQPTAGQRLATALRTVVAITVTPFDESGAVDPGAYRRLVRRLVDGGVTAVTPNGNTSEFYALSPEERRRCVDLTVSAAGRGVLVVPGVGLDVASAVADARHAQEAGASAVMVHQPVHPFRTRQGWLEYHLAIADAVPGLPLVPYVKDAGIDVDTLRELLRRCPDVVAVKYAVPDPLRFGAVVDELSEFPVTWLCGLAEHWAPMFAAVGAEGFTSGLVNVDPGRSLRLLESLHAWDMPAARAQWCALREFEELRARDGSELNVSVVKESLAQLGLCRADVRAPISRVPDADRQALAALLDRWEPVREAS